MTFLFKILERAVSKQMTGYLQKNNLLTEFQYTYRRHQ